MSITTHTIMLTSLATKLIDTTYNKAANSNTMY
jgi:hypothetical protein